MWKPLTGGRCLAIAHYGAADKAGIGFAKIWTKHDRKG